MLLLSSTAGFSCLATDMLGGRRQGDDFSLSLHTLCKGLWKFLFFIFYFFSVLSFPKACRKSHHSEESPEEKAPALGHVSEPSVWCQISGLWIQLVLSFVPHTEISYSHRSSPQEGLKRLIPGSPLLPFTTCDHLLSNPFAIPSLSVFQQFEFCSLIQLQQKKTGLRTLDKHFQLTWGEHRKEDKICPSFFWLLKYLISVGSFFKIFSQ